MNSDFFFSQTELQLLKKVGEGLTSDVYLAHRSIGQGIFVEKIIVKILKSKTFLSEWKNEIEFYQSTYSPYHFPLVGVDFIGDKPVLFFPYKAVCSLAEIYEEENLSENAIQYLLHHIKRAIRLLHRQNFFHGDLSLKNILISESGQIFIIDGGKGNLDKQTPLIPYSLGSDLNLKEKDLLCLKRIAQLFKVDDRGFYKDRIKGRTELKKTVLRRTSKETKTLNLKLRKKNNSLSFEFKRRFYFLNFRGVKLKKILVVTFFLCIITTQSEKKIPYWRKIVIQSLDWVEIVFAEEAILRDQNTLYSLGGKIFLQNPVTKKYAQLDVNQKRSLIVKSDEFKE